MPIRRYRALSRVLAPAALCLIAAPMTGCSALNGGGFSVGTAISSGADLYKAVTLSDGEVQSMALQATKESDRTNRILTSGPYAQRLQKLTAKLRSYDGLKLEFKVYQSPEVNAFAMANGSIRIYSGLMDKMTDDELLFVLGHEAGHVKFGHSKEKVRLAYGASAARKGVAASSTVAGALAASELGAFTETLVNAQFSQSEESESDRYGLDVLKKLGRPAKAAPAALRKLADLGGDHNFLSSHPDPEDRAKDLEELI